LYWVPTVKAKVIFSRSVLLFFRVFVRQIIRAALVSRHGFIVADVGGRRADPYQKLQN
jgi:hypothetical protein